MSFADFHQWLINRAAKREEKARLARGKNSGGYPMFDDDKPMPPLWQTIRNIIVFSVIAFGLVLMLAAAFASRGRADSFEEAEMQMRYTAAQVSFARTGQAPRALGRIDPSLITLHAIAAGITPRVALAMVQLESGFNPRARGAAGEYGLTQIKCATARGLGFAGDCAQLLDPATNLTWGLRHFAEGIRRGGNNCAGWSLHNTGIYAVPRCTAYGLKIQRLSALTSDSELPARTARNRGGF